MRIRPSHSQSNATGIFVAYERTIEIRYVPYTHIGNTDEIGRPGIIPLRSIGDVETKADQGKDP